LGQYRNTHETTVASAAISDPDYQSKAHEIMAETMKAIQLLQQEGTGIRKPDSKQLTLAFQTGFSRKCVPVKFIIN